MVQQSRQGAGAHAAVQENASALEGAVNDRWFWLRFNKIEGFKRWRERQAQGEAQQAAKVAQTEQQLTQEQHDAAEKAAGLEIQKNATGGLQAKTVDTKKAALTTCARLAAKYSSVLPGAIGIEDVANQALKDVSVASLNGGLEEILQRIQGAANL